jgi:hypothetical protein
MKTLFSFLFRGIVFFALILSGIINYSYGQNASDNNYNVKVVLAVSKIQEQNFNILMQALNENGLFSNQANLKNAYQDVERSLKNNEYKSYISKLGKLIADLKKLNDEQKKALNQVFRKMNKPKSQPNSLEQNSCSVTCMFGECTVDCPMNTKPSCNCQNGFPQSSCESFGQQ